LPCVGWPTPRWRSLPTRRAPWSSGWAPPGTALRRAAWSLLVPCLPLGPILKSHRLLLSRHIPGRPFQTHHSIYRPGDLLEPGFPSPTYHADPGPSPPDFLPLCPCTLPSFYPARRHGDMASSFLHPLTPCSPPTPHPKSPRGVPYAGARSAPGTSTMRATGCAPACATARPSYRQSRLASKRPRHRNRNPEPATLPVSDPRLLGTSNSWWLVLLLMPTHGLPQPTTAVKWYLEWRTGIPLSPLESMSTGLAVPGRLLSRHLNMHNYVDLQLAFM